MSREKYDGGVVPSSKFDSDSGLSDVPSRKLLGPMDNNPIISSVQNSRKSSI